MPPDPVRAADTAAGLAKAERDLRASEHLLGASPPLLDAIVLHCQQAAEKSLKAFLAWNDVPFRKTHDIEELGRACGSIDASLGTAVAGAVSLTEYPWRFRYPGEPEEPSRPEAEAALAAAREVREAVLARLPRELRG